MRDIKFRAWDKEFKRMKVTGMGIYNGELTCDDSCIIMEYTGLHDKNGKEIYEGDRLLWPDGDIHEVVFATDRWYAGYASEDYDWCDSEVIGNIYEKLDK